MGETMELPRCPHCGCKRSEIVEIREAFGMTSEYRQCGSHRCGRYFKHAPTVYYDSDPVKIVCTNCRAKNPAVVRSIPRKGENGEDRGTIRYHKCGGCGYTFKSMERPG